MSDIVFLGTPGIACPFLHELVDRNLKVKAVITQPDRLAGRGLSLVCPAVKTEAQSLSIPVFQPRNSAELYETIKSLKPQMALVVAYGKLLKKDILEMVPLGFINAHFSLLPKYRGAAPVRRALLNGERETGITVFKIDEGMDTGPVILSRKLEIGEDENSISLFMRLSEIGKKALADAADMIFSGKAVYTPQTGEASYAPKIEAADTFINFNQPVSKIYNAIRAFSFDPRARFSSPSGTTVQILSARPAPGFVSELAPGFLAGFENGRGIFIKCQDGALFVERVKPEGKKEINACDFFINGKRFKKGDKISND
ncbi:MAG: methionyl-tRNA formyltransferase [Elusimicrobiota bacterium]